MGVGFGMGDGLAKTPTSSAIRKRRLKSGLDNSPPKSLMVRNRLRRIARTDPSGGSSYHHVKARVNTRNQYEALASGGASPTPQTPKAKPPAPKSNSHLSGSAARAARNQKLAPSKPTGIAPAFSIHNSDPYQPLQGTASSVTRAALALTAVRNSLETSEDGVREGVDVVLGEEEVWATVPAVEHLSGFFRRAGPSSGAPLSRNSRGAQGGGGGVGGAPLSGTKYLSAEWVAGAGESTVGTMASPSTTHAAGAGWVAAASGTWASSVDPPDPNPATPSVPGEGALMAPRLIHVRPVSAPNDLASASHATDREMVQGGGGGQQWVGGDEVEDLDGAMDTLRFYQQRSYSAEVNEPSNYMASQRMRRIAGRYAASAVGSALGEEVKAEVEEATPVPSPIWNSPLLPSATFQPIPDPSAPPNAPSDLSPENPGHTAPQTEVEPPGAEPGRRRMQRRTRPVQPPPRAHPSSPHTELPPPQHQMDEHLEYLMSHWDGQDIMRHLLEKIQIQHSGHSPQAAPAPLPPAIEEPVSEGQRDHPTQRPRKRRVVARGAAG